MLRGRHPASSAQSDCDCPDTNLFRSASFSIDPHFDRICSHKPEWIRALPWLERFGLLLDSPLTRNIVCALESAGLFLSKQASVI